MHTKRYTTNRRAQIDMGNVGLVRSPTTIPNRDDQTQFLFSDTKSATSPGGFVIDIEQPIIKRIREHGPVLWDAKQAFRKRQTTVESPRTRSEVGGQGK